MVNGLGRAIVLASVLAGSAAVAAEFPAFLSHRLSDSAGLDRPFRETLSPVDLDRDGDLDFFTGQGSGGRTYWFENLGDGNFQPHAAGDSNNADVGAAIADVDGDGDMDRLSGSFLHLNPGNPRKGVFTTVNTGAPPFTHDLLAGDIDGDGRTDFVTINYPGIQWFRNPGPPFASWPANQVSGFDTVPQHGGIALGDFDWDGDLDIFRVNCWFENRDSGKTWIRRRGPDFGIYDPAQYGLSARTVVLDIDMDGDLDLAQAECDVTNGRVAWFENQARGETWVRHLVKDSTDRQDFHSLALADFDGDGDMDFFSCGGLAYTAARHWYVWENLDGKGGAFKEHVIWRNAAQGGHEAVAFDVDGDGDMDILGKEFMGYHVWLENRLLVGQGNGSLQSDTRPAIGFHPHVPAFRSQEEFEFSADLADLSGKVWRRSALARKSGWRAETRGLAAGIYVLTVRFRNARAFSRRYAWVR